MQEAWEGARALNDPALGGLSVGALEVNPVKNVAQPLRYCRLTGG
jgi:hypothetical protein